MNLGKVTNPTRLQRKNDDTMLLFAFIPKTYYSASFFFRRLKAASISPTPDILCCILVATLPTAHGTGRYHNVGGKRDMCTGEAAKKIVVKTQQKAVLRRILIAVTTDETRDTSSAELHPNTTPPANNKPKTDHPYRRLFLISILDWLCMHVFASHNTVERPPTNTWRVKNT